MKTILILSVVANFATFVALLAGIWHSHRAFVKASEQEIEDTHTVLEAQKEQQITLH